MQKLQLPFTCLLMLLTDDDKYFVDRAGTIKRENGQITIVWNYTFSDENFSKPCTATIYSKQ